MFSNYINFYNDTLTTVADTIPDAKTKQFVKQAITAQVNYWNSITPAIEKFNKMFQTAGDNQFNWSK